MDKKYCDNCGAEVLERWQELSVMDKDLDFGMALTKGRATICTFGCMEKYINRHRRWVTKTTKSGKGVPDTIEEYINAEIGIVDIGECVREKDAFYGPFLVVKPEVWQSRIKN